MPETPQNASDEVAVVGEPASQPHQAAVVGEPPEGMAPVLGEPVPLANGLQKDQEPVSSSSPPPSPDESSINGVHAETSPAAEPHSEPSDAPPSASSTLGSSDTPSVSPMEEHSTSVHISTEEAMRQSASSDPLPTESVPESSDTSAGVVVDSSTRAADAAEPEMDIPADVEVRHISETPAEPRTQEYEVPTDNLFSALEEGATGGDSKMSVEAVLTEETVAADRSLEESAVLSHAEAVAHQDQEKESMDVSVADVGEEPASSSVSHKNLVVEPEEKALDKQLHEEIKVPEETTKALDVDGVEPQQVHVAIQESSASTSSTSDAVSGSATALDSSDTVGSGILKGEEDKVKEPSADSDCIMSEGGEFAGREVVLPETPAGERLCSQGFDGQPTPNSFTDAIDEAPPSEARDIESREAVLPEDLLHGNRASKEAEDQPAVDSPQEVGATSQAMPVEERSVDQPLLDETTLAENGFQQCSPDGNSQEMEQVLAKEDTERAEGKEKSSFLSKLPLIFTTVAIAVVGVAVVSIARPR